MNTKSILLALTLLFIAQSKSLAQDPVFTQWENMPLYFNPALTGNFDGLLRCRAKYRNQWASLLKNNAYHTSVVSADYKFAKGSVRKISIGAFGVLDNAGSANYSNKSINLSTSVIQNLGNPDHSRHSIALGLNVGLANRKIDLDNLQWPGGPGSMPTTDMNEKVNFADISAGLLWQYKSNTHFSFQLGSALLHVNRPNVSFFKNGVSKLYHRLNLHGNVEVPLTHKFSVVPSFLFWNQGPSDQLLFGFNNKWYFKSLHPNFAQLGFFAKTTDNYNGRAINVYVLSATVQLRSFLLGFSVDRFQAIESNAYELSVGYTFGMYN
ncbi:MAG TPA: PorP/SprF family type IX secretion system membrane protein [Saprospiraceae bacterium]|nr:PorP/SprF family type IX secretion system membrane protein [Saprospiraceae bacterium]